MARTIKGSKATFQSYGAKRLGNKNYLAYPSFKGGKHQKKQTHKIERQQGKMDILAQKIEEFERLKKEYYLSVIGAAKVWAHKKELDKIKKEFERKVLNQIDDSC